MGEELTIEIIEWRDHWTSGGWKDKEDYPQLLEARLITSVGWVLIENRQRVVLIQTRGGEGVNGFRDTITIEKSCIVSRKTLVAARVVKA